MRRSRHHYRVTHERTSPRATNNRQEIRGNSTKVLPKKNVAQAASLDRNRTSYFPDQRSINCFCQTNQGIWGNNILRIRYLNGRGIRRPPRFPVFFFHPSTSRPSRNTPSKRDTQIRVGVSIEHIFDRADLLSSPATHERALARFLGRSRQALYRSYSSTRTPSQ